MNLGMKEIEDTFRKRYLSSEVPEKIAETLFLLCWDRSFSGGVDQVEGMYADFADLVNHSYSVGYSEGFRDGDYT